MISLEVQAVEIASTKKMVHSNLSLASVSLASLNASVR